MNRFAWLLFGALALAGTAAVAVDIDSDFKDLDTDKNGYISADESKDADYLSRYWYRFDSDNNGRLDESEFSAFEETDIDTLEPYVLRHDWYGSVGPVNLY